MITRAALGTSEAGAADGQVLQWGVKEMLECPLCGAPRQQHREFEWVQDEYGRFRYVLCRRCGLVFQSPAPDEDTLARYYADQYHGQMLAEPEDDRRNSWVQRERARHLIHFLDGHLDGVRRHLDIGCSRGSLLEATASHFGCQVFGVEPGKHHRELAVEKGLEVVAEIDLLAPSQQSESDLISLSHVLEHLIDPVGYLRELRRNWLAAGGHLLVEVPSLYWHRALERSHLTAFAPATMRGTLAAAGFQTLVERRHGQPYSRRFPLFILVLAQAVPADRAAAELPSAPRLPGLRRRLSGWLFRSAQFLMDRLAGRRAMRPWLER